MNLNINYKRCFKVVVFNFLVLAAGFIFTTAVFAQTASSSDIPPELASLAQELGCNSKEACETAFHNDLDQGIRLAQKYNVYSQETQKLAQTFKTEVLSQLTTVAGENFEEAFVRIAEEMIRRKPTLARSLNLEQKDVTATREIVTQFKEKGVSLNVCSKPAESLSREQLIACLDASKNLAENKDVVKDYISEERLNAVDESDAMIKLQEALNQGQYSQLGTKDTNELGNVCLRPGSPAQCDEIAAKFFGSDGVKYLAQARQQVSSVAEKYFKQAESFTLFKPDGQTITGEDAIRDTCEQAFNSRDLALAKACGNFAVKNGFASNEEIQEAVGFLQSMQQGVDLGECRRNPKSCEQFIPQDRREDFNIMRQMQEIMTSEIGFSPEECEKGAINHEIGQRCFEGSQRALPKLESLAQKSPQVRQIINEIRGHISNNEKVFNKNQEFQQTFQSQQGGPGGCKSSQECFTYCSNPSNGPECIAFGAKHEVFSGQEAVTQFQKYSRHIENAPSFSGQGAYPGFIPPGQGGFPPGQYQGFREPGPGFSQPPGFGGNGPGPECFAALRSGDFVKAKEVCTVPGATDLPTIQPINIPICPALATVSECPAGQEKVVTYSSPQCGTYYDCRLKTDSIHTCPSGQYWNGTSCVPYSIDGSTGCAQAGGIWENNYCKMPGTNNCSSGQYYDYNTKICVNITSPSGQKQQTWNSFGLSSQIRTDADPARIEQLKQACANVKSGANVWEPGAGSSSSPDFGMPSAQKCQIAASCLAEQYFDGASCVSNTFVGTICGQNQYWDSPTKTCKPMSTTGGTGCGSSTAQASQSACLAISGCTWFNSACSPSPSTTTCSSGQYWFAPTDGSSGYCKPIETHTCPSGQYWNGTACVSSTTTNTTTTCASGQYYDTATSTCKPSTTTTCASGQYWNGTACVSSTTTNTTTTCPSGQHMSNGSCVSDSTSTTTTCSSGQYWNGTACVSSTTTNTTTTCPSGQYWNGTACVSSTTTNTTTTCPSGQHMYNGSCVSDSTSTTTTCSSGQYWNGTACVSSTTTTCSGDQYWNGTACVSPTSGSTSNTTTSDPSTSCAKAGGTWNGTTCQMPTTLIPSQSTLAAISGVLNQLIALLQSLLR